MLQAPYNPTKLTAGLNTGVRQRLGFSFRPACLCHYSRLATWATWATWPEEGAPPFASGRPPPSRKLAEAPTSPRPAPLLWLPASFGSKRFSRSQPQNAMLARCMHLHAAYIILQDSCALWASQRSMKSCTSLRKGSAEGDGDPCCAGASAFGLRETPPRSLAASRAAGLPSMQSCRRYCKGVIRESGGARRLTHFATAARLIRLC